MSEYRSAPVVARLGDSIADYAGRNGTSMETKDAIGEIVAAAHAHEQNQGERSEDLDRLQLYYQTSLWVYAAAFAISSSLASVPLVACRREGDAIIDDPSSDLQALVDAPAAGGVTGYDLSERIAVYLKLTGTAFVYADRGGNGAPNHRVMQTKDPIQELRVLRTSRVSIMPDPGFAGGIGRFRHTVDGKHLDIAPQNIGMARQFNPSDDYWGLSPIAMILKSIDVDEFAETWNRALVESGGSPDAIAETEAALTRTTKHRLRHEWDTRFDKGRRGGLVVMDSGLKIKPAGFSPKEMEFAELVKISEQRILAAFGVPPLKVMDLRDASVLANADVQLQLFWAQTVVPTGDRIAAMLTRLMRSDPRFPSTEGWGLRYRWEDVAELVTIAEEQAAREHYIAGGITLDEYRGRIGEAARGADKGGDELYRPPVAPNPFAGLSAHVEALKGRPGPSSAPAVIVPSVETKGLARAAFRRLLRVHYPLILAGTKEHFEEQTARVIARLGGGKSWRAKALDVDDLVALIFPRDEEDRALRDKLGPLFLGGVIDAGNLKLDQLFPESTAIELEESTERLRSLMQTWTASRVVGINAATVDAIRSTLEDSILAADTNQEMERRLLATMQSYNVPPAGSGDVLTRAERIARTESGTALNSGSFTAALEAQSLGIELRKTWLSSRDPRVRDSHESLDAATSREPIALEDEFANGLRYPNDPSGPAEEVINCRCSMVEVVVG